MQSRFIFIGIVALLTCMPVTGKESSLITRLDTTGGSASRYEVVYVVVNEPKKSLQKTVAVILRQSDEQDLVYVYRKSDRKITLELLTDTSFAIPKKDHLNFTKTTVRVTAAQYDKTKSIITSHFEKGNRVDTPETRFFNCVKDVLKACSMRIPYRSPYRPPNLTQWVGDIPAYSKDIVLKH